MNLLALTATRTTPTVWQSVETHPDQCETARHPEINTACDGRLRRGTVAYHTGPRTPISLAAVCVRRIDRRVDQVSCEDDPSKAVETGRKGYAAINQPQATRGVVVAVCTIVVEQTAGAALVSGDATAPAGNKAAQ